LRVAEQANEEKIIGKEHLPLDFEQAVSANTAVAFAAYHQINLSCGKSNGTNTTISFSMRKLSHTIKRVSLFAVLCAGQTFSAVDVKKMSHVGNIRIFLI